MSVLTKLGQYGLLLGYLVFAGCSNSALETQLAVTKEKLAQTEAALAALEAANTQEQNALVHLVYFPLKPDASMEDVFAQINTLRGIEVVQALEIGKFENLEDERALADFQVMMALTFANTEDYRTYQEHEIHLALKQNIHKYLAGVPATYDYRQQ